MSTIRLEMKRPNDLLTVGEAAIEKGVHVKSVYRAIERTENPLPAEKRGKTRLIRRKDLEEWKPLRRKGDATV